MKKPKWTAQEDQTLAELYPTTGVESIRLLLPRHTKDAIHNRAHKLGVKADQRPDINHRLQKILSRKYIASIKLPDGTKRVLKESISERIFNDWLKFHRCRGLRVEMLVDRSKHPFQRLADLDEGGAYG